MAWSKEVFAKNLRYYMESRGKNQKELAEIVGVSAPTMNDWLKGKKYPRIDKIEILANYFGILKSDLIEDKSSEEKEKAPGEELTEGEKALIKLLRRVPAAEMPIVIEKILSALDDLG